MTDLSSIYTLRTLVLEAAFSSVLAAALRVRAEMARNFHLERDAQVYDAAAAILEAGVQQVRTLAPEHADMLLQELGDPAAVERAMIGMRRSTLRVVPEPAPETDPPRPRATRAKKHTATARTKQPACVLSEASTSNLRATRAKKPTRVPKDSKPR